MNFLPGDFVCSCGYLRAGKTMNAVRIAYGLHRRGWPVVSNIDVSFSCQRLRYIEELYEVRQSVVLLDEIQDTLDSREFAKNATATRQGIFFGKRGNIILMTTPHFGMLDVRFRQLTQYVFLVRKVFFRGAPSSVIQACWYSGVGDAIKPLGKFVMAHRPYYGLYDTLDEHTALVSRDVSPSASRQRERRDGGASAVVYSSSRRFDDVT